MKLPNVYASVLATSMLISACGSANFSGSGQSGSGGNPPASTDPNGSQPPGTTPNGQNPNGTSPNGTSPNGTSPTGPGGQNPGTNPSGPGSTPGGTNPGYPGGYPGGQTPGNGPQNGPDTQIITTPNSVTFGKDKVFHIGNNRYSGSSCREQIAEVPISGRVYFFQFDVPADTKVSVNVSVLCGTDLSTNDVMLYANNVLVQSAKVIPGAPSVVLPPQLLKGGTRYTVYVTSGQNSDNPNFQIGDFDDFIVGKVVVQGEGAVTPVGYGSLR